MFPLLRRGVASRARFAATARTSLVPRGCRLVPPSIPQACTLNAEAEPQTTPMRIAIATQTFPADPSHLVEGGVAAAVRNLLVGIRQLDDPPEVHLIHDRCPAKLDRSDGEWIEQIGAYVHRLPRKRGPISELGRPASNRRLLSVLREIDPDIVHVQSDATIPTLLDRPAVLTIHGIQEEDSRYRGKLGTRLRTRAVSLIQRKGRRQFGDIIAITGYVYRRLRDQGIGRCHFIPNAADNRFFEIDSDPASFRRVLFAGVIGVRKNPIVLAKAMADLIREGVDAELLLGRPGGVHRRGPGDRRRDSGHRRVTRHRRAHPHAGESGPVEPARGVPRGAAERAAIVPGDRVGVDLRVAGRGPARHHLACRRLGRDGRAYARRDRLRPKASGTAHRWPPQALSGRRFASACSANARAPGRRTTGPSTWRGPRWTSTDNSYRGEPRSTCPSSSASSCHPKAKPAFSRRRSASRGWRRPTARRCASRGRSDRASSVNTRTCSAGWRCWRCLLYLAWASSACESSRAARSSGDSPAVGRFLAYGRRQLSVTTLATSLLLLAAYLACWSNHLRRSAERIPGRQRPSARTGDPHRTIGLGPRVLANPHGTTADTTHPGRPSCACSAPRCGTPPPRCRLGRYSASTPRCAGCLRSLAGC